MPNIDQSAKDWQEERSKQFGQAVAKRRGALGLTAVQLSERTKALGYPMTRSTIARIEGNHRAGKVDLAEIVTLAAALDTAPTLLLFPNLVDGRVRPLPDRTVTSMDALSWFYGNGWAYPQEVELHEPLDEETRTTRNDAYYNATDPFRLALDVQYNRAFLSAHIRHPEWESTAQQLPAFRMQLERVKIEARQAGLTIDDSCDTKAGSSPSGPAVSDIAFAYHLERDSDA
ncbi:helix-turn-helix domain-containing protein [Mycobacteroides abscessus]|uniref:helix-turn-helix domain-containing protein n=1 Tax=Mycobacteroides abscessus TaxID=36809 RepID=UPI000C25BE7A|nr:helix-turn-helix transcriptional regulator [Mycobacteroides abscessus]RIR68651.1 XRE family transcriptional regulator [Mycobacteroides abscessus]